MLFSPQHNFIFIHVPKAAGTSIQNALAPLAPTADSPPLNRALNSLGLKSFPGKPITWQHFREHATARRFRFCLGRRAYHSCLSAAFVRNPWDWLVSRYHYDLQTTSLRRHRRVKALSSLADFARFEARRGSSQHRFLTDRHGRLIVNFIGRFESLHHDFDALCRRLDFNAHLPALNTSSHRPYHSYYDPPTRDLVQQLFAVDIKLFNYSFNPPAS